MSEKDSNRKGSSTHQKQDKSKPQIIETVDLYQKPDKIYPKAVQGRYHTLRVIAAIVLLGIFYGTPWLQWNGQQAILFDLPGREFHIFGITFWPQDFFLFGLLLVIAAISLFFFTALAGRLWCGYACPQTVWTKIFLKIEHYIEGDRNARMRLDKMPWNSEKIRKKFTKHGVWIVYSLFTGFCFVGYFIPVDSLFGEIVSLNLGPWATFWILFYSLATYGNAGWLREQICIYMCPYARFQSAMFDKNTLIITYDEERGESRGSRKKNVEPATLGLGDCIDCKLCVQVCPTGIDIRDGLQYECIGCAACIDVCNGVMDQMGYDRGLVRYSTEESMETGHLKVFRPRVFIYAAVLLGLLGGLGYAISQRAPIGLDIIRDRNQLYRETVEGMVENIYTFKFINKEQRPHRCEFSLVEAGPITLLGDKEIIIPAGELKTHVARMQVDPGLLTKASNSVNVRVVCDDLNDFVLLEEGRFVGPVLGQRIPR